MRTYLIGTGIFVIVLYLTTAFAPILTETARTIGYTLPESAQMAPEITALSGGNLFAWFSVVAARAASVGGLVILLAASLVLMWRYRPKAPATSR